MFMRLKLSNDEVDKLKSLRKKKRKGIQKRKLINTPCESNIIVRLYFMNWCSGEYPLKK